LHLNLPQIHQEHYEDQGYTIFRQVLDKNSLGSINRHLEMIYRKHPGLPKANLYAAPVKDDPFWAALVADKRLLDIAELFIGSDIALFGANYVVKWAKDAKHVLWHQDAPNWKLEPLEAVTLWIAIDDSTAENGCLKVIPGSHKTELYELQAANETPNIFGWQTDPKFVEEEKAVDIVLKAGDISVHHPKVIHGSGANCSNQRRAGMSIRYIPTTTRIANNMLRSNTMVLRGNANLKIT
jgi:phytanoyl-CoA hydroxylase